MLRLSEKTLAKIVGEVKRGVRVKLVLTKKSSGNVCDCKTNMGICNAKEHFHPCTTYPRKNECPSGYTVTAKRQKRLSIESKSLSEIGPIKGTNKNRPVLPKLEQTGRKICKLAPLQGSSSNRCNENKMANGRKLCFPTVYSHSTGDSKSAKIKMHNTFNNTKVANKKLVQSTTNDELQNSYSASSEGRSSKGSTRKPIQSPKMEISSVANHWGWGENTKIPDRAAEIMQQSCRPSTRKAYNGAFRKFSSWCSERNKDPFHADINSILEFIVSLFDSGLQVNSINVIRAGLSSHLQPIQNFTIGNHPLIKKLFFGIYNTRPRTFKDKPTWKVDCVLEHILSWGGKLENEC